MKKWNKTFPKDNKFYLYVKDVDINWNYDDEGYNIDKLMINGPGGLEYSIYHQENMSNDNLSCEIKC